MYAQTRQATEYHRDLMARAREQRRASHVVALRKASRRVVRAERRLVDAQIDVLRVRGDLDGGQ
jgi:hypothetical protein